VLTVGPYPAGRHHPVARPLRAGTPNATCAWETIRIAADVAVWAIAGASIAGVLLRPRGIPEWIWATAGALLLVLCGLVPLAVARHAILEGTDVYFFLGGMMVLAELGRYEGLFDWIASRTVVASRGSASALFALVFGAGVLVTIVLSNDATAVVLTPAVSVVVRKAKVPPLPPLLACAFVANAASFVLPISNPANLVVFANAMPSLPRWLATFALPSLLAIAATFVALRFVCRDDLRGRSAADVAAADLTLGGRVVLVAIALTAVSLIAASAARAPLGATTFACAALALAASAVRERRVVRDVVTSVTWSILALVAGLFVMVAALDETGLLAVVGRLLNAVLVQPALVADLGCGFAVALVSNLTNNLPAALVSGAAAATLHAHDALRASIAIGIDLGPNLSVTGSLATVLWLAALRRDGVEVDALTFLRVGAIVMPVALLFALASVR
jgi:arsenical pump membrane protein